MSAAPQLRLVIDNDTRPGVVLEHPTRTRLATVRRRPVGAVITRPHRTWADRAAAAGKAGGAIAAGGGALFCAGMAFGASELGAAIAWWIGVGLGVAVLVVLLAAWTLSHPSSPVVTVRGPIIG